MFIREALKLLQREGSFAWRSGFFLCAPRQRLFWELRRSWDSGESSKLCPMHGLLWLFKCSNCLTPMDSQPSLRGVVRHLSVLTRTGEARTPILEGKRKCGYSGLRNHFFCDSVQGFVKSQFFPMLSPMAAATSSGTATSQKFSYNPTRHTCAVTRNSRSARTDSGSI